MSARGYSITKEEERRILKGDYDLLVKKANDLGEFLAKREDKPYRQRDKYILKSSQIRKIFGEIKKISFRKFGEASIKDLLILKPRLFYAAERHKSVVPLRDVLTSMIDYVVETKDEKIFRNFVAFLEAVLAYHKGYGGRD